MTSGYPKTASETRGRKELAPGEKTSGEEHTGITIFDPAEPRSVYNLVPTEVQKSMKNVHPEVWKYSFPLIEKRAKVDVTLAQLRVAFWQEYNNTQDLFKDRIIMSNVTRNICSKPTLYSYLRDQYKCAYLFYPTVDYISAMSEMQDLALREMRKILKMPNAGNKGANMPVIREKIKIFALLENRLRGALPTRHRHEHSHTLAPAPMVDVTATVGHEKAPNSLKEIEKAINDIDVKIKEPAPSGNLEAGSTQTHAEPEAPMAGE